MSRRAPFVLVRDNVYSCTYLCRGDELSFTRLIQDEVITLRLAGKTYRTTDACLYHCDDILNHLDDGPRDEDGLRAIDLPWTAEEVPTAIMDWFLALRKALVKDGLLPLLDSPDRSLRLHHPDVDGLKYLTDLARLDKLSERLGDNTFRPSIRRAAAKLMRHVHIPQATDSELRESAQQLNVMWAASDSFFQAWIVTKFCTAIEDVDRALAFDPPVVCPEFEEMIRRRRQSLLFN
ncbi:hypothetical protein PG987_014800 [Apiospora arundinis]